MLRAGTASAATISVPADGNLQAAINAAAPGDTIALAAGATYRGNFVLPVHGGTTYVTIRTDAADELLPPRGTRISPAYAPYLAKIESPNALPALRTAPGAAFWRLAFLEFLPTYKAQGDVITLGDGSSAQNTLEKMPHHLILDRLYVHGDPLAGQKRGIALNSGDTSIVNSYVSDIKGAGQDTQAIAGWNGAGPYYIANNYLEAAGNGMLIGGDDPKIANLTPSDIVVRGNTVSRPVSWRNVIVPTPANARAALGAGALVPGTYGYRVMARRTVGTSMAKSTPTAEVTVSVSDGAAIALTWDAVSDATDYVVFGRTPGAQTMYWIVPGTSFTDAGTSAGTAGTPPSIGTVWTVKNLLELKNARRVVVDHNVMENNWAQAQTGYAILFTPRNQYGTCTWCIVEDVTFEYNVVRHIGGGVSLTGYDDEHISQQANNIRIRNNEFSDYSKGWGGTGYFLAIANTPRDITVDHNTLISGNGAGVVLASGTPISGFVFTNNVAKHDAYGILGNAKGYGNTAIAYYFPDGVITRNVLAGGSASMYPAGNLFPSLALFMAHFVDYAGGYYALVPGTDWAGAGTDGLDLGANMDGVYRVQGETVADPPSIVTTALPSTTEGEAYVALLEAQGGRAPYRWTLFDGALPLGLFLDAATGGISGTAVQEGDSTFTVQVEDASGATSRQPLSIHVNKAIPPNVAPTVTLTATAGASVPLASPVTLNATPADIDGFIQRVDLFVDGAAVASASGAPFTFTWTAVPGEHRFSALAIDDDGAATMSAELAVTTEVEIVLHAIDVTAMVGAYQLNADATAADGRGLWNPNAHAPKVASPAASPASYAEFQFYAEAGRPYHLWIRGRAQKNDYANDSAYLQFSHVSSAQLGTTSALVYQLEDAPKAGLSGWGWQDNGLGTSPGMMGPNITFDESGLQTLRIQPREDGLQIDQIVISPDRYLLTAPGALKNDTTIVPQ